MWHAGNTDAECHNSTENQLTGANKPGLRSRLVSPSNFTVERTMIPARTPRRQNGRSADAQIGLPWLQRVILVIPPP
jgi:hypothetical protein